VAKPIQYVPHRYLGDDTCRGGGDVRVLRMADEEVQDVLGGDT
jgi:hypothetical protein